MLERQKLMEAEIFVIALRFHEQRSDRELSVKLLDSIIRNLSYTIIDDEQLLERLLYLFELVCGICPPN